MCIRDRFNVSRKNLCTRCDGWAGALSWWNCRSPVAPSCGLLNQLNSFRGGIFKLNTKSDAESLLYSVILNVMATKYTCSLNIVYCPHWKVQWSRHCSHTHIPVHSDWLSGYVIIAQTVLLLTMVRLFLDRSHIAGHSETQVTTWTCDCCLKCVVCSGGSLVGVGT